MKTTTMKRYIALVIMTFMSLSLMAQRETINQLEKFNQVKVYDRIIVTLVKSDENKAVITGDDQDEVNILNKNGLLKIRMEFDNFMDGSEVKVTLYYTEPLGLIDVNENAKIKSNQTLKADRMEIRAQEGGKVNLEVSLANLYTKAISGGEITLTGKAKTQEVMINTGGKLYNKALDTNETTVTVNAGGRADVNASEKVIAKVSAGGYIYIYGNPKDVDRDKIFGGKIKIME